MIEAHRSPQAMARCLISYIDDDHRVRREVYIAFSRLIDIHTIRAMRVTRARSRALAQRDHYSKFNEHAWDWRGSEHVANMARASTRLVEAIKRERRA